MGQIIEGSQHPGGVITNVSPLPPSERRSKPAAGQVWKGTGFRALIVQLCADLVEKLDACLGDCIALSAAENVLLSLASICR